MCSITHHQCSKIAVIGALAAFTSLSVPAVADDLTNLGPVGPHQPILASVGSERVIAFYLPGNNQCAVHAVIWDNSSDSEPTPARIRMSLEPGQIMHIDSVKGDSLNLRCESNADRLAVVDTNNAVAFGIIVQPPQQPAQATLSGF
jgi:hypothetical protein